MIVNSKKFGFWLLLSLLFMILIYLKSGQSYSEQDLRPMLREYISESALLNVLPHVEFTYDGALVTFHTPYSMLEFFIRKAAHVTVYFLLALLLWRTCASTALRRRTALLLTALISIGYAATDEWHQTFVPGRTGHSIDIVVDACGVLLLVLLVLLFRQKTLSKS